jgi:hypothetical protein
MPSQKAAISIADRASSIRIRFFLTAKTITATPQSKKPSSGQNKPEPNPPPLHSPAGSCIKNEADDIAAVSRAPRAPARATPFAHSGSTQPFRASRQSTQVCTTTTPTINKTNSATFPLPSANRFGSRARRAPSPCGVSAKSPKTTGTVEGRCRRIPQFKAARSPCGFNCFDRPCCSCVKLSLLLLLRARAS